MLRVVYDEQLKAEYQKLFDTCIVNPDKVALADQIVRRIVANKPRYVAVAHEISCPWIIVGLIHQMECGLSFLKHLHNGDPLQFKTKHVPACRPLCPPPWTWEESALDALRLIHFDQWKDWTLPGILWKLENYNGLGYRQFHPETKSPYLWSFTNQYQHGKYVADGRWDPQAVSLQMGVAALLKRTEQVSLAVFGRAHSLESIITPAVHPSENAVDADATPDTGKGTTGA